MPHFFKQLVQYGRIVVIDRHYIIHHLVHCYGGGMENGDPALRKCDHGFPLIQRGSGPFHQFLDLQPVNDAGHIGAFFDHPAGDIPHAHLVGVFAFQDP
ncbi:MAG: hypothetical protein JWQ78_917 [Sediminibacterium sp.]|nr:hypothetical protein [Sediminibacterium sp.]